MTTLRLESQITSTVVEHWWQFTRREHRLALRLMNEKPENLAKLPYLQIIISKIDGIRLRTLRTTHPKSTREVRSYLLSAEQRFLECLRALSRGNLAEAEIHYANAHDDLSLMHYILMENNISSF